MATLITHVVDPDGTGDYTSLSSFEAAQARDLVTLDEEQRVECISTAGTEDTQNVSFSGWTTDATRFIHVITPQANRHSGQWTTGNVYRLNAGNNSFGISHAAGTDNIIFEGLQVRFERTFRVAAILMQFRAVGANAITSWVRLRECILWGANTAGGTDFQGINSRRNTIRHEFRNILIFDFTETGSECIFTESTGSGELFASNITMVASTAAITQGSQVNDPVVRNSMSMGNTTGFGGTYKTGTTNNASDIVSDAPGLNPQTGSVVFVNAPNDDYHLDVTDTVAIDNAADLSAVSDDPFTIDIDGEIRVAPWDIGIDEIVSGVVTVTLDAARATATAQDVTATPALITVGLDPAGATASAQDVLATPGALVVTLQAAGAVAVAKNVVVLGLAQVAITLPFNEEVVPETLTFNEEVVAETLPFDEDNQQIDLGGHEE